MQKKKNKKGINLVGKDLSVVMTYNCCSLYSASVMNLHCTNGVGLNLDTLLMLTADEGSDRNIKADGFH